MCRVVAVWAGIGRVGLIAAEKVVALGGAVVPPGVGRAVAVIAGCLKVVGAAAGVPDTLTGGVVTLCVVGLWVVPAREAVLRLCHRWGAECGELVTFSVDAAGSCRVAEEAVRNNEDTD